MPLLTQGKTNWKYILIVVVLAVVVGGGILYWYPRFSKIEFPPIKFPPKPKGEVTITTDKTEYEEGETVKITVRNDLDKDVCYFTHVGSGCYRIPYNVYQFLDGKWQLFRTGKPFVKCLMVVDIPVCEKLIKSNELLELTWNQKVMEDICSEYKKEAECQASSGKYKISLRIGDLGEIYSNEFTIIKKEETVEIVPSEIEGWNIYRNKRYGFEIEYPNFISPSTTPPLDYLVRNSWTCWPKPDSKGKVIASFVACQFSDIPPAEPYHSFTSELRIGASSNPNDVENCLNFWNITPENVNINGKKFKRFKTNDAASGHRAGIEVYRTIYNDTCFSIEKLEYGYLYDELEDNFSPHYNSEYSQKFDSCREKTEQILPTFRFLE